jgi:hypothetical protein
MAEQILSQRVSKLEATIREQGEKLDTIMQRTERFDDLDDTIRTLGKVASGIHKIAKFLWPVFGAAAALASMWAVIRGLR